VSFGLYVHIPFCEQHCHYCAFAVTVARSREHAPYVERLLLEVSLLELDGPPRTLYLGGGTPSLLDSGLLRRVVGAVEPGASEITIEANPGTLGDDLLRTWMELGVNRVSLGVQSFDEGDLRRAGRLHSTADALGDYELLGRAGFDNVNLDLIAGLPGQERRVWLANLDWVERLAPEHVSVYLLELEDSTVWARRPLPIDGAEDHAWFYEAAADRLGEMGYLHYEVSSWARPRKECRHNQGYWNGVPYRGVGLGAHSFLGNTRFWNTRSMREYADRLDRRRLPVEDSEARTPRVRLEEAFLLGLRQMSGFDVTVIARELGIEYPREWFDRVGFLESAGMVEFDDRVLRLAPRGWLLTTGITEELLCPGLLSICEAIQ